MLAGQAPLALAVADAAPARVEPTKTRPQVESLQRDSSYRRLLVVADLVSALLALTAVSIVDSRSLLTRASAFLLLLAPVAAKLAGLYDRDAARLRKSTLDEVPALLQMATLFCFGAWLLSPRVMHGTLRPGEVAGGWLVLSASLIATRTVARQIATRTCEPERCLFVGTAAQAAAFADKLDHDRSTSAAIIAQLDLDDVASLDAADARAIITEMEAHRVIIAPDAVGACDVLELMRTFEGIGAKVSVMPALLQVVGSAVEFDDVDGTVLMGARSFHLTRSSMLVKRAFDLVGASVILLLVSPLMALFALAIHRDSPGGIFFRQRRIGRDGQDVHVFKFRTMVADAEARKAELATANEAADGFFKISNDPRITRIGALLRKTSLDELPQLFNVLRGEMSLVGPRPLIPEEDVQVVGWNRRRLALTPGMTGPWQVLGSSRVPLREMVAIDYLYVGNWSLWSDLKIMLRTVPHVVARRSR